MDYFVYLIIIILLSIIPQIWVHITYRKYSQIRVGNGKTGAQLVEEMLAVNGVSNVSIHQVGGVLSDHYNSKRKTINLSRDNFVNPTVASIAVAAHETGHALQDNKGYFFLKMRHALGPVTIVASKISWIAIYLGFLLFFTPVIWLGIICLGVIVLFDLITLPVELNASARAKEYLTSCGSYSEEEISGVSKVLTAAAFTYVAASLAGILQLIRLLNIVRD